jgi:hypothetical protein
MVELVSWEIILLNKIIGKGKIYNKLYDNVVRILNYAKHIPDLKGNCIFLGVIESIRWKFQVSSEIVEVCYGFLCNALSIGTLGGFGRKEALVGNVFIF